MSNENNLTMRFALEAALKQTKKPRGFKEGHKAGVRARGMIYADDAPYQKFIEVDPGIGKDGKPTVDGVVIGHKFSTDFGDRGLIIDRDEEGN